jgi:hypothetical protein
MKEITLANNKGVALIDDEDFELVSKYKWSIHPCRYAQAWILINSNKKRVLMHRLILGLVDVRSDTDHVNHNKLDNRKCNLRICNRSDNAKNRTPSGRSKYLGVTFYKVENGSRERMRAMIRIKGKYTHIGSYDTEELAARAYDEAANLHHGEFANLNFK